MKSIIATIHTPEGSVHCGAVNYDLLTETGALVLAVHPLDPFQRQGEPCWRGQAAETEIEVKLGWACGNCGQPHKGKKPYTPGYFCDQCEGGLSD